MADQDKNKAGKSDGSSGVALGAHIQIFPNMPLPAFNGPGGPAFAARSRNEASVELVAIVCSDPLPARSTFINAMRALDNPGIPRLRESGVVLWPPKGAYTTVFVYERPVTQTPYWQSLNDVHAPMGEDALNRHFLTPMVNTMAEFQRVGLTHGGIRPTNIFWHEGSTSAPQLGECLSAPAGLVQPVLFETLERGMCTPAGRGPGSHIDDTYALGVTAALLMLGQNPLQNMDDQTILQTKIDKGTFNAFVGNHRLPASHIELLRGLLTDDARQRWTAADLQEWLTGRRLTPKSSEVGRRSNRSFSFCGKDYWNVRSLATAFAAHPEEAAKVIEDHSLEKWIARSLDDQKRSRSLSEVLDGLSATAKTGNYQAQLVARVCIALDPPGPLHYRGLTVMPDGVATLLADVVMRGQNPQIVSEIITSQLVTAWVNEQQEAKVDLVPLAQQLERLRGIIDRPQMGSGIERAVYELNPTLACLSPMVRGYCVTSARAMLPALEQVANAPNRPTEPMDRHIAGFLLTHDKRSEKIFEQMSPPHTPQKRALALLTLFSEMQYRFGPEQTPGVSSWLMSLLENSVKRFFNRPMREKIHRQLKDAAAAGQLSRLETLLDDPTRLSRDESEFLMARLIYRNVIKEMAELQKKLGKNDELLATIGRPLAASVASFFAILMIAFVAGRAFLRLLA